MSIFEILLTAVGLSMDAFAVSVTNGLSCRLRRRQMLENALCFGFFQGLMPVLGFFCGLAFAGVISRYDHYVALVLLSYIGGKMLLDAFHAQEEPPADLTLRLLLVQGIATSIDALAVGVSFAALFEAHRLWPAVSAIGGVTFLLSLTGVALGRRAGECLGSRARMLGGLLLIGLGVKIFAEHVFF